MRVVAGLARGHKLKAAEDYDIRPTSDRAKEALFSILSNDIEGCYFLDIFSGSGAIAIEALSRGAAFCALIEQDKKHCQIINENIEHVKKAIGEMNFKLLNESFEEGIMNLHRYKFDVIFMDPPYNQKLAVPALDCIRRGNLLKNSGIVVVEQSRDADEISHKDYEIIKDKVYGHSRFYFLQYKVE